MLANNLYSKITISALAYQAQVNHNTIYYYFKNIDDMAIKLFNQNMSTNLLEIMVSSFASGNFDIDFMFTDEEFKKNSCAPGYSHEVIQHFFQIFSKNL